jgi:riboflavin kinase/FMN adenylyltransferase
MILVSSLEEIPSLPKPIALTIGTFDGVHRGHQYLLSKLKKYGTTVVLTFSNHPAAVLSSKTPPSLSSLQEKLDLFRACGIDCVIVVPFTRAFADQPYDTFLTDLKKRLPFSTLILGKGDGFGKGNAGNETRVKELEIPLNFKAVYLEKLSLEGKTVSSTHIRELLQNGEVEKASLLLGHQQDHL